MNVLQQSYTISIEIPSSKHSHTYPIMNHPLHPVVGPDLILKAPLKKMFKCSYIICQNTLNYKI